jgi:hypothetical protein
LKQARTWKTRKKNTRAFILCVQILCASRAREDQTRRALRPLFAPPHKQANARQSCQSKAFQIPKRQSTPLSPAASPALERRRKQCASYTKRSNRKLKIQARKEKNKKQKKNWDQEKPSINNHSIKCRKLSFQDSSPNENRRKTFLLGVHRCVVQSILCFLYYF